VTGVSDDLRDLYQEVILEHARSPRNRRALDPATPGVHKAEGFNRLCGDRLNVYLHLQDGVVQDVCFEGSGCAISTASASLMTQSVKGHTEAEIEAMFRAFHALVTEGREAAAAASDAVLGKLEVFAGVREFPARVKCASLAWHTMHAALKANGNAVVSTED